LSTCGTSGEQDVVDGFCLGRPVRRSRVHALTVVDAFTREALAAIDGDRRLKGEPVVEAMARI